MLFYDYTENAIQACLVLKPCYTGCSLFKGHGFDYSVVFSFRIITSILSLSGYALIKGNSWGFLIVLCLAKFGYDLTDKYI